MGVYDYPLQFKPLNEIDLCLPTSRFESALTNVVVIIRARKGEVVGQQDLERTPVLFLPSFVVLSDNILVSCTRRC